MKNVIDLAAYCSPNTQPEAHQVSPGGAQIIQFARRELPMHDLEQRMLDRAEAAKKRAVSRPSAAARREWRDLRELVEVMIIYTDHFDIRERCKLMLSAA